MKLLQAPLAILTLNFIMRLNSLTMKILYFTNTDKINDSELPDYLIKRGHELLIWADRITLELVKEHAIDFIVSDRPRTLIKQNVIEYLPNKIINLHPAYLPWNRGYHPLYFSIRDGNPSGNSIHYIDEGIDTGDIIARSKVEFDEEDTLFTAYQKLRNDMVRMFDDVWPLIEQGINSRKEQKGTSTHYWKRDFDGILDKLPNGWNTSLNWVRRNK